MKNTPPPLTATLLPDCKRFRCPPGWHRSRSDSTNLRDQELWLVWAGRGTMTTATQTLDLHPGCCIWMRPGHIYDAKQNDSAPLGITYLHFTLNTPRHRHPEFYELWDLSYIDSVTHRIVNLADHPAPASHRAANHLLTGLLNDLITHHQCRPAVAARKEPLSRHQQHLMQQIARYIHDTADTRLTVGALARKAGYSLAHFSSLFKKTTGQTVEDMIIRARIEKAQQLLRWGDLTVSQIADQIGYRDVYFFSRQFKVKTGQSPTQYRAAAANNNP